MPCYVSGQKRRGLDGLVGLKRGRGGTGFGSGVGRGGAAESSTPTWPFFAEKKELRKVWRRGFDESTEEH